MFNNILFEKDYYSKIYDDSFNHQVVVPQNHFNICLIYLIKSHFPPLRLLIFPSTFSKFLSFFQYELFVEEEIKS